MGNYPPPKNNLIMSFTVVIPFYNGHKTIHKLLASIPEQYPVVIVDDLSDEPLQPKSIKRANVTIHQMKKKGFFTGAVNAGIRLAKSDVLVLNQDAHFTNQKWVKLLEDNRHNYAMIGERIKGEHPAFPHGYIHGTFMFASWEAIQKVGLMDSVSYPLWGSTADWQLRFCRAGYKALPVADVPGFVHERGNRRFGDSIQSLLDKEPHLKGKLVRTPPTISVVIACKNYGRFLPDAIHSLIGGQTVMGYHPGQTFQGFEIVVVDYGSTDNTKQIMSQYTDGWQGVRFLSTPDKGTANACNVGVKAAIGKYIAMLDADDTMLPHRLEAMLRKLEANPGRVIVDNLLPFNEQGELIKYTGEHFTWKMPSYDFNQLIYKNSMHKGILYEKRAWELAGGYPEKMTAGREDWAFNVACGRIGFCGLNLTSAGYLYRRQEHNRTLRNNHRYQYFLEEIKGLFPDVYYAGGSTMCCGSEQKADTRNLRTLAHKSAEALLIGREGMTTIEYMGNNAGSSTYWGAVTGQQYRFGGSRKYGFVDNRDVPGLLSTFVGGKAIFRIYVAPKAVAPADVASTDEAIPEPQETIATETAVEPAETLDEAEPFDPGSATVVQVQAWLDTGPSKAQISLALNAEQSGKARKTVLAMLTAAVEA